MVVVRPLRSLVKRALGHQFAAPEILYNCILKSSLDPCIRWLISVLRIWFHVLKDCPHPTMLETLLSSNKARLGAGAKALEKHGVRIRGEGVLIGDALIPITCSWGECREMALKHIKEQEYRSLAERRPNTFDGIAACSVKHHRRFLRGLPSYEQSVLLKIWDRVCHDSGKEGDCARD